LALRCHRVLLRLPRQPRHMRKEFGKEWGKGRETRSKQKKSDEGHLVAKGEG
jgi:hypothetical protein